MARITPVEDHELGKFTDKHEVKVITKSETSKNSITIKKTTITSTPQRIEFPEEGNLFKIYHITSGDVIWIGTEETIAVGGESMPIPPEMQISMSIEAGDEPNIWGVTTGANIDIYVYGEITE